MLYNRGRIESVLQMWKSIKIDENPLWRIEEKDKKRGVCAHEKAHQVLEEKYLFPVNQKGGWNDYYYYYYGLIDFDDRETVLKITFTEGRVGSKEKVARTLENGYVNSLSVHEMVANCIEIAESPQQAILDKTSYILTNLLKIISKNMVEGIDRDVFIYYPFDKGGYSYFSNFFLDKLKKIYQKKGLDLNPYLEISLGIKKAPEKIILLVKDILEKLTQEDIEFIREEAIKQAKILVNEIKKKKQYKGLKFS